MGLTVSSISENQYLPTLYDEPLLNPVILSLQGNPSNLNDISTTKASMEKAV